MANKTILIGISGGIHSLVAAYVLKRQGHHVIGVNVLFAEGEESGSEREQERLGNFLQNLGIPYHCIREYAPYRTRVIDFIASSRLDGRLFCARTALTTLLFDVLCTRMAPLKADRIATGHRARLTHNYKDNGYPIYRSKETRQDQSHLLALLPPEQLAQIELPLAGMRDHDITKVAQSLGTDSAPAPSCLDHTFANLTPLLENLIPPHLRREGNVIHHRGQTLIGTHKGIHHFCPGAPLPADKVLLRDEELKSKHLIPVEIHQQDNKLVVMEKTQWIPCTHILLSRCRYTTGADRKLFSQGHLKIGADASDTIPVHIRHLNNGNCLCEAPAPLPSPLFPGESAVIYGGRHGERVLLAGQVFQAGHLRLGHRIEALPPAFEEESRVEPEKIPTFKY